MKNLKYYEEPRRSFGGEMSETAYIQALDSMIIDCTDFIPINRARRTLYLAKRVVHSGKGIWRFGGRRRAGESMEKSCARLAYRELRLTIDPARFIHVHDQECIWAWRKQAPTERGCHTLMHLFTLELHDVELAHATKCLDPDEYDRSFGIQEFTRAQLVTQGARAILLDDYDAIFPTT